MIEIEAEFNKTKIICEGNVNFLHITIDVQKVFSVLYLSREK